MKQKPIEELKRRLLEISHFISVSSLLDWDQQVNMPIKGADNRAVSVAHISSLIHSRTLALDSDGLLTKLKRQLDNKNISGQNAVIVAETWRGFERAKKLPAKFVHEMAEISAKAQNVWAEARAKNDFKLFLPWLQKIVALKRQEAKYIGYKDSPYDALIDSYEQGMTTAETIKILNDLKDFLIPFLKKISATKTKLIPSPKGDFPIDRQLAFNKKMTETIGFDLEAGRLDKSTHPFTLNLHPNDVRITTRFKEHDLLYAIGSTIHETGHALYEQGLLTKHFGTPLGEYISLGIHESQSRLWENNIGKSLSFWKYFYPKLQKEFPIPYKKIPLADFYKLINQVHPSLIRTEADEVTYNLHIIIRFEIEREMIEGTIDLADLPAIWRAKVKEYLGIEVPNDTQGVLQDVHWSGGMIGYFPTYSFGNLYAAQFCASMEKQIPDLKKKLENGDFAVVKNWLNKNIHRHGKTYSADALVKKVTGESLNSRYFAEYLKNKYEELYDV